MAKVVRAKSLGWAEELTPEQFLELEPFSGPFDLEGELEIWEAADRTVYVVGGYEADPDTIEDVMENKEVDSLTVSVSQRARISLKAQLAGRVGNTEFAIEHLIEWYENKGGAERIMWGQDGDWTRCYNIAKKYLPDSDAKGFCANRHYGALGYWPGEKGKPGNPPLTEK